MGESSKFQFGFTLWVRIPLRKGALDTTFCDKVYQWLATGQWFSPGTPVSSINKTDRHDIAEILLKVVLNTINPPFFFASIRRNGHKYFWSQNNKMSTLRTYSVTCTCTSHVEPLKPITKYNLKIWRDFFFYFQFFKFILIRLSDSCMHLWNALKM